MSGRNLKVNLVANTSQFKSAMSETSNQMKLINSEFKSAAAETDQYGNKLDQTGAKKKQLNGVIEQYTHRIKAIKTEQQHWTRELEKGNITEEEHAQKQQELARRLNNTEGEMKRYEGQLKKLNSEGKKTRMTFDEFDKKFRDVGRTMRDVGAQVGITTGVGFMALKRVLGDVIEEASSFHAGMSEVQAISGATGEEMGKLTDQAKRLGRETVFTSQEASEAMSNLARAGFDANEIYDAMPGLLDLAASSNLELGTAANITSNIIRAFNFDAEESGRVADVLSKGAATANTDVEGLGQAMEVSAPVAQSLGVEFESVAASAGIMADAGIDGSKSGRMLRQGMLRLSKPTGEAGKLLEEMGVNAFDADGNMKSLDKVVGELEKGLEGQNKKQRAAALSTIFGSESTAGWTVLLEEGSDVLKDYTGDLEDSEGAAKEMADVMQDNAEGAITRMQSALSGLKIELGEKLLPTLATGADFIADFATGLSEMDESTIETIAETALLVTALLGVTTVVAGLVAGIGAFMMVAGPVGAAIAAGTLLAGALGIATRIATKDVEKASEVNLDHANSLVDQASGLEDSVNAFERLSDKAEISNEELGLMYDLHKRMEDAANKDELAKLSEQYDKLAEKSGFSKEEIKELFGANESIIEQSDEAETAIGKSGEAWVENTDAVNEYIQSLYEASRIELESQRDKQLKNEEEITKRITKENRQLNDEIGKLALLDDLRGASQKELLDIQGDIVDEMNQVEQGSARWLELNKLLEATTDAQKGDVEEMYGTQTDIVEEKRKQLNLSEAELEDVQALNQGLVDVWLKQTGIKEEGEKGLNVLEEKIAKNDKTIASLDAELEKEGKLTNKQQEKYDKAVEKNGEYRATQEILQEEYEVYGSINTLLDSHLSQLDEGTLKKLESLEATHDIEVAEGNIYEQLQKKQGQLVEERDQLEENLEKKGANKEAINEEIKAIDKKIATGDEVLLQMLEELDLLDLVKDGLLLNSDELEAYLETLGYSTEEAAELAKILAEETIDGMNDKQEEAKLAGTNKVKGYLTGMEGKKGDNKEVSRSLVSDTLAEFGKGNKKAKQSGTDKGDNHAGGVGLTQRLNITTGKMIADSTTSELNKGDGASSKGGQSKGRAHDKGLGGTQGVNVRTASGVSNAVSSMLGRTTDGGGGQKAGSTFSRSLKSNQGGAQSSGRSVASSGVTGLRSVSTSGAGNDFVSGFRTAIANGSVSDVAARLGRSAVSSLKRSIRARSPSKATEEQGINFTDGFAISIDKSKKKSIDAAAMVGRETVESLNSEVDGFKQSFGAIALAIEGNKQTLKVEHTLDDKFEKMLTVFKSGKSEGDQSTNALLQATLKQNEILMKILAKNTDVVIGDDDIGRAGNRYNSKKTIPSYFNRS